MPAAPEAASVQFSHVHIYCDALKDVAEYKQLEKKLNAFAAKDGSSAPGADLAAARADWLALSQAHGDPITGPKDPAQYSSVRQDVVEQMLVALGWRITGFNRGTETQTFLITSSDKAGVKFVVTAHTQHTIGDLQRAAKRQKVGDSSFDHFDATHLERFAQKQCGHAGVAVLGFTTYKGGVEKILAKYKELHPKLLLPGSPRTYPGGAKVLEVYAYYLGEKCVSEADTGTLLRFVEPPADASEDFLGLPGLERVEATFDRSSVPAYCDHWVSNVVSRNGFIDTLNDTLGFTPKVDFNAGVVAAGEAQIESTVAGNEPGVFLHEKGSALQDNSQVYLPINNALSEVGHVHLYLKEIGQGIQHIASRVADLPQLVQRANDLRKITGAGLSFLSIPSSYYGTLTAGGLAKDAGLDTPVAESCVAALRKAGIVDASDIVRLDLKREEVLAALPDGVPEATAVHVLRGRYRNLYGLLRDHVGEDLYLSLVRNNILVDVQGEDLLMQIFTSTVLQRNAGEEAPFLEFIQRVCSDTVDPVTGQSRPIKPGCGGFGIRNFLTLFLSIEVTKATKGRVAAETAGKVAEAEYYKRMVDAFTAQLEESNPVLTLISDAMTAEGAARERGDSAQAEKWAAEKAKGQTALKDVSAKYNALMKELREKQPKSN